MDVLVLYNEDFKSRNSNEPSTQIDQLVALANQAYLDSEVSMQIRVVAMELIDYSDLLSNSKALDAISKTYSSPLAVDIADLCNQTGADLVIFVRPYNKATHGGCGLAHLNNSMLSHVFLLLPAMVKILAAVIIIALMMHLLMNWGHTMGLSHDDEHTSYTGSYPYSYGYGIQGTFGTIMAYITPDVFVFSNPDIDICNDSPCGTADANNALSLTNDKETLSGFRDEVEVISQDSININSVYYLLLN